MPDYATRLMDVVLCIWVWQVSSCQLSDAWRCLELRMKLVRVLGSTEEWLLWHVLNICGIDVES